MEAIDLGNVFYKTMQAQIARLTRTNEIVEIKFKYEKANRTKDALTNVKGWSQQVDENDYQCNCCWLQNVVAGCVPWDTRVALVVNLKVGEVCPNIALPPLC